MRLFDLAGEFFEDSHRLVLSADAGRRPDDAGSSVQRDRPTVRVHRAVEQPCAVARRFTGVGVRVLAVRDERLGGFGEISRDVAMQVEHSADRDGIAA